MAMAAWLAGCGGGGDSAVQDRERPQSVAGTLGPTPIPADANVNGMFGPVIGWPLIPLHNVLLADGRVLSYGTDGSGRQTGNFIYDVWDPAGGVGASSHLTLPNTTGTDIFCASQVLAPAGDGVIISGGDNWTGKTTTNTGNANSNFFRSADNTLTRGTDMALPRWYATSTILLNGEMMIQGGIGATAVGTAFPEVRGADGSYRALVNANTSNLGWTYPRNFIAPDGRVFGIDTSGVLYHVDTAGEGTLTRYTGFIDPKGTGSTAAMFAPGRILQLGGTASTAVVVDITAGGRPVVTPTQSLSAQRFWGNATLLPNGKVLASGGSRVDNQMTDVVYPVETWDPVTGTWTLGPAGMLARLYHSTALLLPDASVLVAGGGAPGPQVNTNAEIYYPPYLFAPGGTLAPRPQITVAPGVADIGSTVALQVAGSRPIGRVSLIRAGSVTHSFNNGQLFSELTFVQTGSKLSVQMPTQAWQAPPGTYMLFVLDDAGVPSEARMVRINVASVPNPALVPVLAQPADQAGTLGAPATLVLSAVDPNGDTLAYTAAGLPAGLSLGGASGIVSGTPSASGVYNVTVTASDGINAASRNFIWTVAAAVVPLNLQVAPGAPPPSSVAGAAAPFAATAAGTGVEYQWTFGDGSAPSAWSASGAATHVFGAPGSYAVSVTARNPAGFTDRRAFLQSVYLPATVGAPTASSGLLIEPRTGGAFRIWMVNEDNDSVSVFDGATRARLAEISVGRSPRTLARAADGRIWVSNRLTSTISIVDPVSLSVVSNLSTGPGTGPFGIVMAPDRLSAYVALESTGRVLRLNTATRATVASADVGAFPRHLSLDGAGTQLMVSRFITPPQPGESTLNVQTTRDGVKTGGEVVLLDAATLVHRRTVVLEHSTQPDTERSGRGVPNYLGAAVISPDGTQAWVPSKQDNIQRGTRRDGNALNFQSTVRAIVSRVDLALTAEDPAARIDLDNASLAGAAAYSQSGAYLFVTLETSREVAVVDAHRHVELFRFDAGRAPRSLLLTPDGETLLVENFMDRTLGAFDLRPLLRQGLQSVLPYAATASVVADKLAPDVLKGKQFFYDARDRRLALDGYLSCATCHDDGLHDGRVWDLSNLGEGLRRTIALRGKGREAGQGFRHWSGNFDEVQDFETQIRTLAGGSGLMDDAAYAAGTTAQPLGESKAGKSADLDALAAYVNSLTVYDNSPHYPWGTVPPAVTDGKAVFVARNCAACHGGGAFSSSGHATLIDIGTVKPASGNRLGGPLPGIDPPTLRGLYAQTSFLHDGSAATIEAAVQAHRGVSLTAAELANLGTYLRTIGSEEPTAPMSDTSSGTGLAAEYFKNPNLTGSALLTRTEAVDFSWGTAAPASGLPADKWSARWSGLVEAPLTGTYLFQVIADDSVRVWIDGELVIDAWGRAAGNATFDVHPINRSAGDRMSIVIEHADLQGASTLRLRWGTPGAAPYYSPVPASRLYGAGANLPPVVSLSAPPTVTAGASVTLGATATDPDGSIVRVEFYSGTTLLGTATSAPYNLPWTPTAAGTYALTARATDNGGASTTSSPTSVVVGTAANAPPTVSLSAPASGTVGVSVALAATASDTDGSVARVDFYSGATLIGTDTTAPYTLAWTPAAAGTFTLTARATDNGGVSTTSAPVSVVVGTATNAPPSVSLSAPASGTVGVAVALAATAADTDGSIARVDFYSGATLVGSDTTAPYTLAWTPTAAGTFSVTARATDNGGALATSVPATIVVAAPANAPPTVTLTSLTTATVGTPVALSAAAADSDGSVTRVDFYDGATLIGTDTTAPFALTWTPAAGGTHVLTGRATDNGGASTTSAGVTVTVSASTAGTSGGLTGTYFANTTLTGPPALTRVEPVNLVWSTSSGSPSPGSGIPENGWSAQWKGAVQLPADGTYTIQITADDGIRVRIGGVTVVDRWANAGNTSFTLAPVTGAAGTRLAIEIDHYDGSGDSTLRLRWRTPSSPVYWSDVPASQQYSN